MLVKTHKKYWAGRHSKLLYWTSNGQFKSKIDLPLKKVSKITCDALTTTNLRFRTAARSQRLSIQ